MIYALNLKENAGSIKEKLVKQFTVAINERNASVSASAWLSRASSYVNWIFQRKSITIIMANTGMP